jgi:hypothetical protein
MQIDKRRVKGHSVVFAERIEPMGSWWVRTEETYGFGSTWHGPFEDVEVAERAAIRMSGPLGAEDKFAELIHGPRGGKGKRIREFYLGKDYLPGSSGWYDTAPPHEVDIPPTAGQ